ncbi:MAG: hypothetical protein KF725_10910 [Cyclobacteriaceae bacterium]|nr:hypothetical protein [Cyclobacteriaceae bacterium]UYN86216.1 MAG: hypothetical protein KIT51_15300 [Cyclobacteriaceae bacterium]
MKTALSFALTLLISVSSFAIVRTVSNDATRPAQFNGTGNTGFVAAHTASSAGDTIYVYGSPFDYGTLTISKRLVVIGAGYAPNNQFGQPTRATGISLFRDGSTDPSGSVIIGFFISGSINCTGTLITNNVTVFRNRINNYIYLYINSTLQATGWTIYNNIVYQVLANATSRTGASATNILIANNIITGSVTNFNSNTVLIDHNVFLGSTNLYQLWNAIVTNNIFVRASGDIFSSEVVFCTFNKNISLQNTIAPASLYNPTNIFETTFTSTGGGSNSGSGNLVGTNPLFVNVPNNNTYDVTYNYRLQAGSPGKAPFSTDGTDAGIYGGTYPFPSGGTAGSGFDTAPMPPIPQVTAVNIQNATIAPNGTLNVQVQGRVNN